MSEEKHARKFKIPFGSYIFNESFARSMSVLSPEDELAVRRAIDAFAFRTEIPELSNDAMCIFEGLVRQIEVVDRSKSFSEEG